MATRHLQTPTLRAQRFIDANRASPLVYQSYDETTDITTFRLADNKRFDLTAIDCASIRDCVLLWRHLSAAA